VVGDRLAPRVDVLLLQDDHAAVGQLVGLLAGSRRGDGGPVLEIKPRLAALVHLPLGDVRREHRGVDVRQLVVGTPLIVLVDQHVGLLALLREVAGLVLGLARGLRPPHVLPQIGIPLVVPELVRRPVRAGDVRVEHRPHARVLGLAPGRELGLFQRVDIRMQLLVQIGIRFLHVEIADGEGDIHVRQLVFDLLERGVDVLVLLLQIPRRRGVHVDDGDLALVGRSRVVGESGHDRVARLVLRLLATLRFAEGARIRCLDLLQLLLT
jgi:hypothetical protein